MKELRIFIFFIFKSILKCLVSIRIKKGKQIKNFKSQLGWRGGLGQVGQNINTI